MDEKNNINFTTWDTFRHIEQEYDMNTCKKLKDLFRCNLKLAKLKNRRIFLLRCRTNKLIPQHIFNNVKYIYSVCLDDHPFQKEVSNILSGTRLKLLNLEIKITIWKITNILKLIRNLETFLSNTLSPTQWAKTLASVKGYGEKNFIKIKSDNIRKFEKFFINTEEHLNNSDEKVIYNFTNRSLPAAVERILKLDSNFGLPTDQIDPPIVKIIKDLEGCINKVKADGLTNDELIDCKNNIRARGVNVITNFIKGRQRGKCASKQTLKIIKDVKATKEFLKQNVDLIVMRSDKGNSTVIMLKEEYIKEMNVMVNDVNTYIKVKVDPTSRFQNAGNILIKKLVEAGKIEALEGKRMKTYSAIPPRIYGLRKTHKTGCKLRPVVSSIGSPGYELASYLHKILSPYMMSLEYNVKDSFQFVDSIKSVKLDDNYVLVSFDVVSLFTNVHKNLVIKIIQERWNKMSNFVDLDQDLLIELIEFCFDSGYFVFDNNFYLQKEGCAMGSPASPSLAIIAVDYVISKALSLLDFEVPIFKAYVDDLFTALPRDQVNSTLQKFNSIDEHIQFTVEIENRSCLPYLDVLINRLTSGDLTTGWYNKPYSSGKILNFKSNHPLCQKLGVAQGFFNRAIRVSHQNRLKESVDKVKKLLSANGYPVSVIKKCESTTKKNIKNNLRNNTKNTQWAFCRFPFIRSLSPKIGLLFRSTNCKLVYYNLAKVKLLYTKLKDVVSKDNKSCLVYKIPCSCNKTYVGQTKQKLKMRLRQHMNDCKPENIAKANKTALATHHFDTGHQFKFEEVVALDYENNFFKRNVSEMVHIQASDTVNFRSDTQGLSVVYNDIIRSLKNRIH